MTRPVPAFRNAPIKAKLVIIILAVSASILFVAAAMILAQTILSGRQRLLRSVAVNSNLLGEYCLVPLSFDDAPEAGRILSRIQSVPWIRKAVLYDTLGAVFAAYNPREEAVGPVPSAEADWHAFGPGSLTFSHRVVHQNRPLGTLVLHAGTDHLRDEVLRFSAVLAALFALLILLSYILALRMQGLISKPLLDLAEAIRNVRDKGDLSQRVNWGGKDEIGELYEGYNQMLEQLQTRLRERDKAEEESKVRQQQLLQAGKLVTLGTLVSGVAHEINNPNAFIMLNASLALKQWRDLEAKRAEGIKGAASPGGNQGPDAELGKRLSGVLENVYEGSRRIDAIVKRLKDYYRKDQARAKVPLDINAVVEKAMEILEAKIRKSTRNFVFRKGEGLPPVLGNFQELEQVLINLIENSCQALPDAECPVRVGTALGEDGSILVEVEDGGSGISPEHLERITDPFFTTKRDSGGTGLGLPLALSIVSDHGGRLKFASVPGKGTTATMTLPAHRPDSVAIS